MKRLISLALMLTVIFSFSGCTRQSGTENTPLETENIQKEESPKKGGEITVYSYKPDTLCPLATNNEANARMLNIVYDGLFSVDSNMNINPCLAESCSASDENRKYTVKLKKGIKFHDGSDFSAQDVVYSAEILKSYPESIYGYNVSKVNTVRAVDDYTVEFRLSKPLYRFAALLDFPVIKKQAQLDILSFQPVGTGGFRFENRNEGNMYRLERWDGWHGGEVMLDRVNVKLLPDTDSAMYAFSLGEISVCPAEGDEWGKFVDAQKAAYKFYGYGSYDFIGFNHVNAILKQKEIRQAAALALDREAIFESGASDFGDSAAIPVKNSWGLYDEKDNDEHDLNKAREILEELEWSLKGGVYTKTVRRRTQTLKFDILVNEESVKKEQLAKSVSEALGEFGISTTIKKLPYEQYLKAIESKNYDMFIGSIDFSQELDFSFLFGEGNVFGVDDADLFFAQEAVQKAADPEEYMEKLGEFKKLLSDRVPFYGIGFENQTLLYKKDVKGKILPAKTDIFFGIEGLWVK